jgi:hypothetical protein
LGASDLIEIKEKDISAINTLNLGISFRIKKRNCGKIPES